MQHLKKFTLLFAFILIFLSFTPISFAIPGKLIYDISAPPQTDNSSYIKALSTCQKESENNNSLYKKCQFQKSQLEKTNVTLTNELSQEKRNIYVMELLLGVVVLFSTIVVIFLIKRVRK